MSALDIIWINKKEKEGRETEENLNLKHSYSHSKRDYPVTDTLSLDRIILPGQLITEDIGFMRGHGTFIENETQLYSSLAGHVERVNKLVSVKPLKTRYIPEIGDVVIGRVNKVSQKMWDVDINAYQYAQLQLSAIHLPGGIQRRKLESDELQIRKFFIEGELLSAEVQSIHSDGSVSIHTRNLRYGKLFNGCLISVSPCNIKRCKSHFHTLPCGIDIILGLNGYIWISKHMPLLSDNDDQYAQRNMDISIKERENISRLRNCIEGLDRENILITDTLLIYTFEASLPYSLSDLLVPSIMKTIIKDALFLVEQIKE